MSFPAANPPEHVRCPIRRKTISSLTCHSCPNHIQVLFKSEIPPELQCTRWKWSDTPVDPEEEWH